MLEPLIFPGHPVLYAALDNSEIIRERLRETGALGVAVGSGTINDLVKLAAGDLGQPYAVVGTAASMDGYSGFGAPMSKDGVKVTMPCPAPAVVLFDLDVAAAAPPTWWPPATATCRPRSRRARTGSLSDAVGLDPIDPLAWELVQSGVAEALSQPKALAAGDPDAYAGLVSGLVLSGLAMQVYRGTRPASGAEHYFSHLWELDHLGADWDPPLSHGHKVAIGTLAMSAFYERFLARDLTALDIDAAVADWAPWDRVEADIRSRFTGALADHAVNETRVKYVNDIGLRHRLHTFVSNWDALKPRIVAQLRAGQAVAADAPRCRRARRPEDIGLTRRSREGHLPEGDVLPVALHRARPRPRGRLVRGARGRGLRPRRTVELITMTTWSRTAPLSPDFPENARPDRLFDAYVFDLDGTIYLGDHLLPGVAATIELLRRRDIPVRFLSNNPTKDPHQYEAKLDGLGLPTPLDDIANTIVTTVRWLTSHHPDAVVFPIAERPLVAALENGRHPDERRSRRDRHRARLLRPHLRLPQAPDRLRRALVPQARDPRPDQPGPLLPLPRRTRRAGLRGHRRRHRGLHRRDLLSQLRQARPADGRRGPRRLRRRPPPAR